MNGHPSLRPGLPGARPCSPALPRRPQDDPGPNADVDLLQRAYDVRGAVPSGTSFRRSG